MMRKIIIASDHAGYALKSELQKIFHKDFEFIDLGTDSDASVDYPDFAHKLADSMSGASKDDIGILICGSGVGISIAANRHQHIRAALCHNVEIAKLAREHNDANVLVLGARFTNLETAKNMLFCFANTEFAAGRHADRVKKI